MTARRRAIEAAEDAYFARAGSVSTNGICAAYDAIERAIYADLRAKVEGLEHDGMCWSSMADVLALLDEEDR